MVFQPGVHAPIVMNNIVQEQVRGILGERYRTRFDSFYPASDEKRTNYNFSLIVLNCREEDRDLLPFVTFEVYVPSDEPDPRQFNWTVDIVQRSNLFGVGGIEQEPAIGILDRPSSKLKGNIESALLSAEREGKLSM